MCGAYDVVRFLLHWIIYALCICFFFPGIGLKITSMIMHEGWCQAHYIVGDSHTSRTITRVTGGHIRMQHQNKSLTAQQANNVVKVATRVLSHAMEDGISNTRWWNPGLRRLGQGYCLPTNPKCGTCMVRRVCRQMARVQVRDALCPPHVLHFSYDLLWFELGGSCSCVFVCPLGHVHGRGRQYPQRE